VGSSDRVSILDATADHAAVAALDAPDHDGIDGDGMPLVHPAETTPVPVTRC